MIDMQEFIEKVCVSCLGTGDRFIPMGGYVKCGQCNGTGFKQDKIKCEVK